MAAQDKRPGVRGPRGPGGAGSAPRSGAAQPSGSRSAPLSPFQRASLPVLAFLTGLPRWLLIIVLGGLLFLGLIQTGPLAWLGALILGFLTLFFAWLLALSWPAISPTSRALRAVIVVALACATVLKALGRL